MYITLDSRENENKPGDINKYQHFDLVGIENVDLTPLNPGQEINFNVKFTAASEGYFKDSIGVIIIDKSTGDTCVYKYFTQIEAFAGNQFIMADDYDFKEQSLKQRSNIVTLQITNPKTSEYNATTDLKITGYTITGDPVGVTGSGAIFEIDGLQGISETNPLYISPGANHPFQVSFGPNAVRSFSSQIKFIADTSLPDNLTLLKGVGIQLQPGLMVNSYDWGERLVDPNYYIKKGGNYDFTPYPNTNKCLKFFNDGTSPVTLSAPVITENINGNSFLILNEKDNTLIPLADSTTLFDIFNGIILEPNEQKIFPVYFHPKTNGQHELELMFFSDASISPTATLRGIGVFPKVGTEDLDFGNKIVGTGKVKGQVKFTNKLWANDNILTITDLRTEAEVNSSFTEIDSNGIFRWNRNDILDINGDKLVFPIKLKPGEFFIVKGEYEPKSKGDFKGRLITVSDAEVEAVSTWTGTAIVEGWSLTSDEITTCRNLPKTLNPTITNSGSEPMTVTKLSLNLDAKPGASLNDFTIGLDAPFQLLPGEVKVIPIIFTPSGIYNNVALQLNVETNSVIKSKDVADLMVSATFDEIKTIAKLIVKGNKAKIEAGTTDAIKYTIELDRNNGIQNASDPRFKVVLTYGIDFLGIAFMDSERKIPKIEMGSQLIGAGYSMLPIERKIDKQKNIETLILTFTGNESIFNKEGKIDLITISFDAYLPYYLDNDTNSVAKNKSATINHEIVSEDDCLTLIGDKAEVLLDSTCADIIRPVSISSIKYGLQQINPNPIGISGGEIKFSVGGRNIFTEIKIYNSSSQLISTVFSANINSGNYSVRIPIEDMSSGVYFYEMTAGPFKDMKKLVIQK